MIDTNFIVDDMVSRYFKEDAAMDTDIKCVPDSIEPMVKMLENKNYRVKYASPGHANTKFANDKNDDGIVNGKFNSTARIIFNHDYKFANTPEGWEWKILENKSKALYVKPYTYNEKQGSPKEAFKKWQAFYLGSLKDWIKNLPMMGNEDKDAGEDKAFASS